MEQTIATAHTERFNIGSVVGAAFSLYLRNFLIITFVAAVAALPVILFKFYAIKLGITNRLTLQITFLSIQALSLAILSSIVIYVIVHKLREGTSEIGGAIAVGVTRVIYAFIMIAILFALTVLLATLLGYIFYKARIGFYFYRGYFFLAAFYLCLAIIYCRWFLAVPVSIIDRVNPFNATARSVYLTRGYRWHIFGLIVIFILLFFGADYVSKIISREVSSNYWEWRQNLNITKYLIGIPLDSLAATATAYSYYLLNIDKDGVGVDEVAKVFE